MRKIRIILWILIVFVLGLLIFSGAVWFKWRACERSEQASEITHTSAFPSEEVPIAKRIPFAVTVTAPWGRVPAEAEFAPGKGSQLADTPEIHPGRWSWGKRTWEISCSIQPFETGKIPEGTVKILMEGGPNRKNMLNCAIPGFQAIGVPSEGAPGFADLVTMSQAKTKQWIWIVCIALAAVILICWLIFRKHQKSAPEKTVWELALDAINALRNAMRAGKTSPEQAVISLTDVVRRYLEQRFHLRAEHQTTGEFLHDLQKETSPLDLEQKRFLQDFLSSADLVKFAKLPADSDLFDHAAVRAESLVRNTAEQTAGKEKKA